MFKQVVILGNINIFQLLWRGIFPPLSPPPIRNTFLVDDGEDGGRRWGGGRGALVVKEEEEEEEKRIGFYLNSKENQVDLTLAYR